MTDQLSGGLPFAPQPKSYADTAGDYLAEARKWLDGHTPGLGAIAPFLGGAGGAALTGATQGDILNDPRLLAKIQANAKAATPFGGPRSPNALFGPSTLPQTAAPMPQGLNAPPAAATPPALSTPPSGAPAPLPPPINVGAGTVGPSGPQVSNGGYNFIDAQANGPAGPTSVGGAPLAGYAGVTPQNAPASYNLGARVRNASAALSDNADPSFFQRNTAMMRDPTTGDFLDPQAGNRAQATGPDLIQKFMTYLHSK